MRILLTGATGLIGSHLLPQLMSATSITLLTRNIARAELQFGQSVGYLSDLNKLSSLDDYDTVINLAGEPIVDKRWSEQQKSVICHSRWDITAKLTELILASQQPPSVFISGSAIGYYGRQAQQPLDEESNLVYPEFSHEICKKWEQLALDAASDNTRVCILRTGIVLAKHGGALAKMLPPFKLGMGGHIGNGTQYISWIHIQDMVQAILFLLENAESKGIYNLTAPTPVTNKAFSQQLAKTLHRPCLLPVPESMLKLMMGESAELLLYGQRVVPKRLLDEGYAFSYPELGPALESLNL